jgi:hypothetical protein
MLAAMRGAANSRDCLKKELRLFSIETFAAKWPLTQRNHVESFCGEREKTGRITPIAAEGSQVYT